MSKITKEKTEALLKVFEETSKVLEFKDLNELEGLVNLVFDVLDDNKTDKTVITSILNKGLSFKEQLFVSYMAGGLKSSGELIKRIDVMQELISTQKSYISVLRNELANMIDDNNLQDLEI